MTVKFTWKKKSDVGSRIIGEEFILYRLQKEQLWMFNQSGREVWECLDQNDTVVELMQDIAERNNCSVDQVSQSVQKFLYTLSQCDLLELYSDGQLVEVEKITKGMNSQFEILCKDERAISGGLLELTYRCNLRCRHCYVSDFTKEMPFELVKKALDDLQDMGCVDLTISGGAIFLRKDVFEILDLAIEKGFKVSVIVSGTLLTEEMVQRLATMPLRYIKVSLYSLRPEIHELITGLEGSFDSAMGVIKRMAKFDTPIMVNTLIQRENADEIGEMKTFAEELGCEFGTDYKIFPRHDGDRTPLQYHLDQKALVQLFKDGLTSPLHEITCGAGSTRLKINPEGKVYACELLNHSVGSIQEQSLREIWHGRSLEDIKKKIEEYDPEECQDCKLREDCLRCPAEVWTEGNLVNEKDEMMCFKARCYQRYQKEVEADAI